MRNILQAIYDYPGTTFCLFIMSIIIINEIGDAIRKRR